MAEIWDLSVVRGSVGTISGCTLKKLVSYNIYCKISLFDGNLFLATFVAKIKSDSI